jgi:extracellular elastinolytic metalloproteinase
MRSTALIALLPLLATLATARPHDHHHGHKHDNGPNGPSGLQRQRKTLSFGPKHGHASFETIDTPVVPLGIDVGGLVDVDPKEVARAFIAHKIGGNEGESFYLREDVSAVPRPVDL